MLQDKFSLLGVGIGLLALNLLEMALSCSIISAVDYMYSAADLAEQALGGRL